jgi:uncharacterized protein with PIN domain
MFIATSAVIAILADEPAAARLAEAIAAAFIGADFAQTDIPSALSGD